MKKPGYVDKGKALKKLGVIDYDLRSLSPGQKSAITRLSKEYGHAIKHPELFKFRNVGKETARALSDSGYKVTKKGRAIIPLMEFDSVKIKNGTLTYKSGDLTEQVILSGSKEFHKNALNVSRKRLGKNQMLTAKIGDSAPFNTRFNSYAALYKYVSLFAPKDPGMTKKKIMGMLSIVTIEKSGKDNVFRQTEKTKGTPVKTVKKKRRN